jgi:hypothetical protein
MAQAASGEIKRSAGDAFCEMESRFRNRHRFSGQQSLTRRKGKGDLQAFLARKKMAKAQI